MADFSIALRNYAGIPVVELVGKIDNTTLTSLEDLVNKLVRAGHYNAILNLKQATWQNLASLPTLQKIAQPFHTHYGKLDVIADSEQIQAMLSGEPAAPHGRLQFHTSEGQALMRLKGIQAPTAGDSISMPAHLAESS